MQLSIARVLLFAAVRMNGVVKTDETDSLGGESFSTPPGKDASPHESAVIQPPGIGPAIHLNGSACQVQDDQPVQVCIHNIKKNCLFQQYFM